MADFKTHITVSSAIGIGYGAVAYSYFGVPGPSCLLAGGLCSVSGMLPDIDSDSGVPLRESVAFAAAVIPMMAAERLGHLGLAPESIVLIGAGLYLLIRFGLARLLKLYTVHRGMFHSVPAALIFGEVTFLLSAGPDVRIRCYKAGAVVLGYLTHLMLDELYSFQFKRGRIGLKSSFGTAMKLFGHGWWPNLSTYVKLILLSYLVFQEPAFINPQSMGPSQMPAAQAEQATDAQGPKTAWQQAVDSVFGYFRR